MADEPDVPEGDVAVTDAKTETETDAEAVEEAAAAGPEQPRSHVRLAMVVGLAVVVALGGLTGWLGYRAYQVRQAEQLRELVVSVGRQGAINLTTIDFEHADADVQRILDSSTDAFYDDFAKRSQPFVDVVKQAKSKSVGTINEAGLERVSGNEGQVLVAVTVKTENAGAQNQPPRNWRMRLTVKKTAAEEAKVSKVEFVP
ncbi:Mce protein [Candidatus Mycolicibacterium alkanivorans]|uniref:Mce protein n=1 Tax=Candidatus Mycolicibacterium alkanivorans TaxID=2954114 RepID=A0ABS9YWY1_9MYCO|nr:Mce protein [Candidatus Mycolicibacterium alkanivorans]MCI4674859.1 Mce protein [Candidatus Mycolicibacterium alkanivorans]